MGAFVKGGFNVADRVQLAARLDYYKGKDTKDNVEMAVDLGVNYFITAEKDFAVKVSGRLGTEESSGEAESFMMAIINLQYGF